ncbi:MAG: glycosyltransferase family 4 protein [Bacteroidetes bacterium]|nr:glycosyltransferase family 4 protein [Bacteroidota bacterium]
MRIAVSGYIGKKKTGIGRVLEEVLKNAAELERSNEFYLFVNKDQEDLLQVAWPTNINLVRYHVSKETPIGNILWHQYGFQHFVRKFDCQIALIPNFSLLLWKAAPTVVIIHDTIEFVVRDKFSNLRMIYRHVAVPLMAKKSDLIVTVSNTSRMDIVKFTHVDDSKIRVIYNGFDRLRFREIDDSSVERALGKYGLKPHSYLLYVGTVDHPGKNLFTVLEAYIKLRQNNGISEKMVVVGSKGFGYQAIESLANDSGYQEDILFLGYINDDDLPYFYAGARLFCFLSLYEGFGLPLLEAMACGCPVVTSNNSALAEVAGDAAMKVPPLNVEMVAKAIYRLLSDDRIRTHYIERAKRRSAMFSWDESASKYLSLFAELLQRNSN